MTDDVVEAYLRTRERMIALVDEPGADLTRPVPACPEWRVQELMAHVVGLPAELGAGRYPGADLAGWLADLVTARAEQPVAELIAEWRSLDDALTGLLLGGAGTLFLDLAVHEHDLRGALDRPDRRALEVDAVLPLSLAALGDPLREAGLGALEVRGADGCWRSHDAPVGWSLHVDAWEGMRAVNSRRTERELLALPSEGDGRAYLPVLDAHLPLPATSLGE